MDEERLAAVMAIGFSAPWWTLDQIAVWIALRHPPLVDSAGAEDVCLVDLVPQSPPLDEEAEIFAAAASPPGLNVRLADSPLLEEIRNEKGDAYEEALSRDLRQRLDDYSGPITLQHVVNILSAELLSGQLPSFGRVGDDPTHREIRPEEWLSLRIRSVPGLPLIVQSVDGLAVTDVRCRRVDVLGRFPELPHSNERPSATPRRRAKGSSPYRENDLRLVAEMRELMRTGRAMSVHAAAVAVAHRAGGNSQPESKVRRLTKLFEETSHRT